MDEAELREATLEVLRGIQDLQLFSVKQLTRTLEEKYKVCHRSRCND